MKKPEDILNGMEHCYGMHSCNDCPYNEDGCVPALWEDAYARLRQLEHTQRKEYQKPLTLHELLEMIGPGLEAVTFCEGKSFGQTYATIWIGGRVIDALGIEPKESISFDSYGKTWRAWAARPTDEERAAAPWEE